MITLVKLSPTEFRWTISLKLKKRKTNCYFRSLVLKTMVLCVSSYVSQFDLTSSLCLQCFSVLPVVILVTYVLIQLRDTYIGQSDLLISDLSDLRHRSIDHWVTCHYHWVPSLRHSQRPRRGFVSHHRQHALFFTHVLLQFIIQPKQYKTRMLKFAYRPARNGGWLNCDEEEFINFAWWTSTAKDFRILYQTRTLQIHFVEMIQQNVFAESGFEPVWWYRAKYQNNI